MNYVPDQPTSRQQEFLQLDCDEAFYGGAAGGGKSQALLMWALEGVNQPGYSAILFRRTFPELSQPGGLIPRSHEWLTDTDAKWSGSEKQWRFPSGAVVKFAHLQHEITKYRYQGGEYIRACFDELTHFTETQYTYILSRLRRTKGFPISPGVRSASNPGGVGHTWVKNRFVTPEATNALDGGTGGIFWNEDRAFVPARMQDNPFLEQEEYLEKLSHLPPVTRARLANGDWTVIEESILKADWFRYFREWEGALQPLREDGAPLGPLLQHREVERFGVVDTAGTSQDKARERRGKPPSYSVLSVWDCVPSMDSALFLRHVWRDRVEFVDLCENIAKVYNAWSLPVLYIENAHHGQAVESILRDRLNIQFVSPSTGLSKSGLPGKVERSAALQNKLAAGQVYLPKNNNAWLPAFEQELLSWTGHQDDIADQVDTSSYAALIAQTNRSQKVSGDVFRSVCRGV